MGEHPLPWTQTHAQLHIALKANQLLPRASRILMAISGGQDSVCLAKLLLDLQPHWDWQLAVMHCDHGWRLDSGENARHVENLAAQWQLPFFLETAVTPPRSEAAARAWRYEVLAAIATTHQYSRIVTGHTATDRAETLLYNLLRGSGADGLQALAWQRPLGSETTQLTLVRPLLAMTRTQTAACCATLGLSVWEDSTNRELKWQRNRIRQQLMPYLRSHFNPQVESSLAQTAEILQAEVAYLEAQTTHLYREIVTEIAREPASVASEPPSLTLVWQIDRDRFRALPLALQRRLARRVLQTALPQSPQFDHIEKLVALATAPNRSQSDPFPGNVIARVQANVIWIGSMFYPSKGNVVQNDY